MKTFDAQSVADALPYGQLIAALDEAFRGENVVPERAHYEIDVPGGNPGTMLLMPAWRAGAAIGVKIANIFPDNAAKGIPAVSASYVLMDATTGVPLALLDGTELTLRRTAAASALASTYLSRDDAARLLMVGTGNLAPHLVAAHAVARKIAAVTVWGRRAEAAEALAARLAGSPFVVSVATDLEPAAREADIISCATLADSPLVLGAWLREGQHLDLVGAFTPEMREADADAMSRARVFVDTYAGAKSEAGDILQAIAAGSITRDDIVADLSELTRGDRSGRESPDEITLFKSVGTALEDLTAAQLVVSRHDD